MSKAEAEAEKESIMSLGNDTVINRDHCTTQTYIDVFGLAVSFEATHIHRKKDNSIIKL